MTPIDDPLYAALPPDSDLSQPPDELPFGALGPRDIGSFSPEQYKAEYTLCRWTNTYRFISGKQQTPIAARSGASRMLTLHAPCMQRIWRWEVRRVKELPICPAPEPMGPANPNDSEDVNYQGGNETLIYAEISPSAPGLLEDGVTLEFYVAGLYVFALATPVWYADGNGLRMGAYPWTALDAIKQTLKPIIFQTGLI